MLTSGDSTFDWGVAVQGVFEHDDACGPRMQKCGVEHADPAAGEIAAGNLGHGINTGWSSYRQNNA